MPLISDIAAACFAAMMPFAMMISLLFDYFSLPPMLSLLSRRALIILPPLLPPR